MTDSDSANRIKKYCQDVTFNPFDCDRNVYGTSTQSGTSRSEISKYYFLNHIAINCCSVFRTFENFDIMSNFEFYLQFATLILCAELLLQQLNLQSHYHIVHHRSFLYSFLLCGVSFYEFC